MSYRVLPFPPVRWMTAVLLAAAGVSAQASAAAPSAPKMTDQFIVHYRATSFSAAAAARSPDRRERDRQRAERVVSRFGATVAFRRDGHDGSSVFRASRALTPEQIRTLSSEMAAADAEVLSVEPDLVMLPQWVPSDSQFASQWHYYEAVGGINLPAAWDRSLGAGVRVAVIDTGYRPHADLAANIVGGYDFIADTATANDGNGRDADARDPGDWCSSSSSWHGTHVAGTIAAVTNNGLGVAGVAPSARIVPVRVLGTCGGYTSDIAAGVVWASGGTVSGVPANAYPARVLNLSLGGSGACGTTMQNAINSARSRSAMLVIAAGNSNINASNASPANCAGVITVGATTRTGARASFSNYGSVVDVAAPGAGILSTLNAGSTVPGADSYASYNGTSMATPHVAGVAALMLAKNAALTPDQVESMLKSSARAFPVSPGTTTTIGTGIVDAKKAVDTAMGSQPTALAEGESNNTVATARAVTVAHARIAGTVASTTDTDYFRVSVAAGRTLSATLNHTASTQNYQLYLYNAAGTSALASSTRAAGQPETVTVRNGTTAAVNYLVRVVYASGGTGSTSGRYVLNLLQQ
ncbi:serine protease [Sphaerotilus sulfidivorans]|uniref:Peptidase S8 n=1 Tax=Sphaerotilus sulfidivorans TaxID=639200 RepID=A0A5C1Q856_9BURK|nr:S8 family peptidase [Sphaerotilus sulfidivorans]QEN02262.1 peptidase S8 [Sphaerotilus sulfidivorans]